MSAWTVGLVFSSYFVLLVLISHAGLLVIRWLEIDHLAPRTGLLWCPRLPVLGEVGVSNLIVIMETAHMNRPTSRIELTVSQ
jgi:hypothetical protein